MDVNSPIISSKGPMARAHALCGRFRMERRKMATIAAAVLAVAVGYHVVFGANGLTVYMQKRQETRVLKQQMAELQRDNDLLTSHVNQLQNDPGAIEHQAREELHYTRPGEIIYTLPEK
jgi:cell division protein FtsB